MAHIYKEFQQVKSSSKNKTLHATAISLNYVKLYSTGFYQPSSHCFIQQDKEQTRKGKKLSQHGQSGISMVWFQHNVVKLK